MQIAFKMLVHNLKAIIKLLISTIFLYNLFLCLALTLFQINSTLKCLIKNQMNKIRAYIQKLLKLKASVQEPDTSIF